MKGKSPMTESGTFLAMMPAVVKTGVGPEAVVVREIAVPRAVAGEARLRVLATGICGTDLHVANDEYAYEAPVVMGHEILGIVDQVGDEKDANWVGKKVVCETYYSTCEQCEWCRAGRRNLCPYRRSLGSFENGGFAQYVVLPVLNLHEVPEALGELDAVLAEPLACVAQCLLHPSIVNAGDRVLVTGPGAMGQLAAQVARAQGGRVVLAGLTKDAERLSVAESLGIETTINAPELDSFDVVIECSGSAPGAAAALRAVKRAGRYVQVGIFGNDVTLPFDLLLYKELVVSSGFASTASSWRAAMSLIAGGLVTLGPLVTKTVPLDEFDKGLEAASSGKGIKTVIVP